jgi:peptidylprolyl isomerase
VLMRLAALLAALALALAACGDAADDTTDDDGALPVTDANGDDDDDGENAGDADNDTGAEETDETTGDTVTDPATGVTVEGPLDDKPVITLPDGAPPTELVVLDVVSGDGEEVPEGATVTTHYVGVSWLNDGEEFDASWNRGAPLTFPLSGVIQGWTDGIPGMRVGGRRLLVIPPELGYGAQSPTPAIAPNDTLVFVIDLVDFE